MGSQGRLFHTYYPPSIDMHSDLGTLNLPFFCPSPKLSYDLVDLGKPRTSHRVPS